MDNTIVLFTLSFLLVSSNGIMSQQNYSGNSVLSCSNNDAEGPSSDFLYTCNGFQKSCLTFLIFKSQTPHNTIATISNLTSSNPEDLARFNNATHSTLFRTGKEGLTTCDSLQRYNPYGVLDLHPGMVLHVPLICACPTARQAGSGTKYLLTYSVNWGDNVSNIATQFHVNASSMVDANGLSSENEMLYPFTIVLIPLTSEPNSTITKVQNGQPPSPTTLYTGYMAPEYLDSGRVTSKMDVYAFGVVLLELITGKDSIIVQDDGSETMLSSIILNLIDKDDAEEKLGLFIDPSLMGNSEKVCAIQLVKLSLACLVEEPSRRPNMAEVVSSLLRIYTEIETRTSPCRIHDSGSTERLNV
ncbi:LysM domain receptor-like kinase [Arachis hypogaea]|nr:LysM domain receptor-like kinase [Arachis hypogaea]